MAPVPEALDRAASWSWRLLVMGLAVVATVLLLARLRLVLLPVAAALLLSTLLVPVRIALTRRGVPRAVAAALCLLGFLALLAGVGRIVVAPLADDGDALVTALEDAGDDVEQWLVDGPLGLDRSQIEEGREQLKNTLRDALATDGRIVDSAILVGEVLAGIVLSLIITFFVVKDGEELQERVLQWVPEAQRDRAVAVGAAAWSTLGRYVLGAAVLGAVEAVIIAVTLLAVGSDVVLPVVVLTFVAAFFPFVGAVIAGLVAVLVTLATAGVGPATIVAVVALLVQQFDNDLLAPLVYGRALQMHPLVVILALTTGAALGGLVGALVAVPATAIVVNAAVAVRALDAVDAG